MNWIRQLFARRGMDRDLAEEIQQHVDEQVRERVERGMTPDEALAAARRAFGNRTLIEETGREVWRWTTIESMLADLRHAARQLRRSPSFTLASVLTVALGIGANTAVFSVVNAVLLRPLPYKESDRLVRLIETVPAAESPDGRPRRSGSISVAEILELRSRAKTLSHVAFGGGPAIMTMSGRGEATRVQGMRVAPEMFQTLGVPPLLGRGFGAAEEVPGGDAVIVLRVCARITTHFAAGPQARLARRERRAYPLGYVRSEQ